MTTLVSPVREAREGGGESRCAARLGSDHRTTHKRGRALTLPAHPTTAPACRRPRDVVPKRLEDHRRGTPLDPTTGGGARCATGTGDHRHPESPRTGRNARCATGTGDRRHVGPRFTKAPATGRNSSAQLELVTEAMPTPGADVVPGRPLATSPGASAFTLVSSRRFNVMTEASRSVSSPHAVRPGHPGSVRKGAANRFADLPADLSGMRDLPEVTPGTVATSPAEVARGLPDVRSSEAPGRRAVAAVRIAARITHRTEKSRAEIPLR